MINFNRICSFLPKDERKRKLFLSFLCFSGFVGLMFSLFSVYTILSFSIFLIGVILTINVQIDKLAKIGLINFLPYKMRNNLLHRSIFDILCDIWFIPNIIIYLKAIFGPFIFNIEPEQAIEFLEELDPNVKQSFLTKGIINLFPKKVQNVVLPIENETKQLKNGFLSDSESGKISTTKSNSKKNKKNNNDFLDIYERKKKNPKRKLEKKLEKKNDEEREILSAELRKKFSEKQNIFKQKEILDSEEFDYIEDHTSPKLGYDLFSPVNSKSELFSKRKFQRNSLNKNLNEKKQEININEKNILNANENNDKQKIGKFPKTELIISSKILEKQERELKKQIEQQKRNTVEITSEWDNRALFEQKKKQINEKKINFSGEIKLPGPLKMLSFLMKKEQPNDNNNENNSFTSSKITKLFLLSSIGLLVQFAISKKSRLWLGKSLQFLLYLLCFLLSTGSVLALIVKILNRKKTIKK